MSFFHGRGGALGRGGGPAAQAVLSLPSASVRGRLRVTEQGEVVAERYGDPEVAHRHLEQLTWATILVSADMEPPPDPQWVSRLATAAERGYQAYRRLLDDPAFPEYFNQATPIEAIESLRIGSRPSRRNFRATLDQLRAIPYTFAWTQSRHLVTGFYGLGGGLAGSSDADWQVLSEMYRRWSFFRALIDNAEQALSKADLGIVRHYASMVSDGDTMGRIRGQIEEEYQRTRETILRIKQSGELLDSTPWLKRSVASRNPRVDMLELHPGRTVAAAAAAGRPTQRGRRALGRDAPLQRSCHLYRTAHHRLTGLLGRGGISPSSRSAATCSAVAMCGRTSEGPGQTAL